MTNMLIYYLDEHDAYQTHLVQAGCPQDKAKEMIQGGFIILQDEQSFAVPPHRILKIEWKELPSKRLPNTYDARSTMKW